MTKDENDVFNYLNTTNFEIVKRFTGDTDISSGLYDVKVHADFGDNDFTLINSGETDISTSLLLIKSPSVDFPVEYFLVEVGNFRWLVGQYLEMYWTFHNYLSQL